MPSSPLLLLENVSSPVTGSVFNLSDKIIQPIELRIEPSSNATVDSGTFPNPAVLIEWSLASSFVNTIQSTAELMTLGLPTSGNDLALAVRPFNVEGIGTGQVVLPFIRAKLLGTLLTGSLTLKLFFNEVK